MSDVRARLERDRAAVDWPWLRPHAQRGALIVVAHALDLVATAVAVAQDDREVVAAWIAQGLLRKPSVQEVEAWQAEPATPFEVLIVQPYVLARPLRQR